MERLVTASDLARFIMPEGADASDFVHGIEVVEERRSSVRYIATLNISFDESKIEQLLGQQSIAYVGIAPKPTLIIPLLWQDGTWLLWEEENTFTSLWQGERLDNRIMTYQVLEGSLRERASLTPNLLTEGRGKERLQSLAESYQADEVMLVTARLYRNTAGQTEKLVLTTNTLINLTEGQRVEIYPRFDESVEELFSKGIEQFLVGQDVAWKARSMTQFGEALELALIVPIMGEGDWAEILQKLNATPVVQEVTIIRMAMPESYLVVRFIGTTDQLALALEQKGLILVESERGWALVGNDEAESLLATRGE